MKLSSGQQWVSAIAGVFFLAAAFVVFYFSPLQSQTRSQSIQPESVERFVEESVRVDPSYLSGICLVAGALFILYAVNGLRFNRLAAGSYSAESSEIGELARKELKEALEAQDASDPEGVETSAPNSDSSAPEPTGAAAKYLDSVANGRGYDVYDLRAVPFTVLRDAFGNWPPSAGSAPQDLNNFEFAARGRGKGNHAWYLKFSGSRLVYVSYGGRNTSGPSVGSI